ncbi:SDR family NAD(P)-dependent oxidoreductase, partial [Paraburkholderia sp.]|uniref:SDR family NAD(P)-dependent oxidoreductase n=1 Tax=Paraburkholderia sp. TaxID=1926495 RepID=UPI002637BF90
MNRLANKVALITGAGRGIGAAIALAFAREGAAVVLAELDIETAQRTARDIEAACKATGAGSANGASAAHGPAATSAKVLAVQTDVTQSASVQHAVREAESTFGAVDVLVNNAGINVFCDPLTMTDDDWRRCFAVDLDGVWNGCRAVLPGMVERGAGSIVNIASTHAFKIIPGCFPYPVAKHGVIGLTRA